MRNVIIVPEYSDLARAINHNTALTYLGEALDVQYVDIGDEDEDLYLVEISVSDRQRAALEKAHLVFEEGYANDGYDGLEEAFVCRNQAEAAADAILATDPTEPPKAEAPKAPEAKPAPKAAPAPEAPKARVVPPAAPMSPYPVRAAYYPKPPAEGTKEAKIWDIRHLWNQSIHQHARPVEATWKSHIDRIEALIEDVEEAKAAGTTVKLPKWLTETVNYKGEPIFKGLAIRDYKALASWARTSQRLARDRRRDFAPCCERAVRSHCMCEVSWVCEDHDRRCYGTHD
jgi:hypothetical protein